MKEFSAAHSEELQNYVHEVFHPQDKILEAVIEDSRKHGLPEIQVGPMDGLHLEVLTRGFGVKKAVEIGTLGGFSGICLCRGMGSDGKLITLEVSEENAAVARRSFERAGFTKNAEVIVGPALLNLPQIKKFGPFDLVFIDANKPDYPHYLKWAMDNVRVGGVILGDNTLGFGEIARSQEESIVALREFNKICATDNRLRSTLLPTGEGLTLAVKIK